MNDTPSRGSAKHLRPSRLAAEFYRPEYTDSRTTLHRPATESLCRQLGRALPRPFGSRHPHVREPTAIHAPPVQNARDLFRNGYGSTRSHSKSQGLQRRESISLNGGTAHLSPKTGRLRSAFPSVSWPHPRVDTIRFAVFVSVAVMRADEVRFGYLAAYLPFALRELSSSNIKGRTADPPSSPRDLREARGAASRPPHPGLHRREGRVGGALSKPSGQAAKSGPGVPGPELGLGKSRPCRTTGRGGKPDRAHG